LLHANRDDRLRRHLDRAAEKMAEGLEVCFLAPELDDESAADVWMRQIRGEHTHGLRYRGAVPASAALVVRDGADAVDVWIFLARPEPALRIVGNQLRLVAGAHARRDDEDVVARADLAVRAAITGECRGKRFIAGECFGRAGLGEVDGCGIDRRD